MGQNRLRPIIEIVIKILLLIMPKIKINTREENTEGIEQLALVLEKLNCFLPYNEYL